MNATNRDPTTMRVEIERCDQHLGWSVRIGVRRRNLFQNRVEKWAQVWRKVIGRVACLAIPRNCVEHRKFELVGMGCQVEKEVLR